jgi:CCR4-NOT complex subunit CAF16
MSILLLRTDGRPQPGTAPVVRDMSVSLQPGSRTLLIGANGAGKTTLLKARDISSLTT